jgi:acetyl esterase
MALHWKLKLLLKAHQLLTPFPDLKKNNVQQIRQYNLKTTKKLLPLIEYKPLKMYDIQNTFFENEGHKIDLRIYKPTIQRKLPIIMFFHGGGFVLNDLETHDLLCRRLAKVTNCIVVAVNYRLAPEFQFPTAHFDGYEATKWAIENAKSFGGNPNLVAVCGDSAGGNIATGVCILAKEKQSFEISYQILLYPCTDGLLSKKSIETLAEGHLLTKELMQWFLEQYHNTDYARNHYLLSPLYAKNLENLPPALIITAEYDPLKDEGKEYAEKLANAGVKVIFQEYKGMIHLFAQMPKLLRASRQLFKQIGEIIRTEFGMNGRV